MILYSAFFSLLSKLDYNGIADYKDLLERKISKFKPDLYWELLGYVYLGIFALANSKREDVLRTLSTRENYSYVTDIFTAVYYDDWSNVTDNKVIVNKISDGIEDFLTESIPLTLSEEAFTLIENTVFSYFNKYICKYDECQLMKLYKNVIVRNETYAIPLNRSGRMHMGIINPWPGDFSGESECIARINRAAKEAGIACTLLSDWGHILKEDDQKMTSDFINSDQLDFVITVQYLTPKSLDAFYYHALWNPPEIPLNLMEYNQFVTNNYLMNDDYLTYDAGGMRNHLMTMLMNKPRSIASASMLTASLPESCMLEPRLQNPKLFYCGMNWDKLVNNQNRHENLFKLLDETEKVKFFGPDIMKNWGGMRPWDGYKCYQYPIPWDGFSILQEINGCGICLVLSSDIHRRAGAVTNRAYEACAAGAVIISDNNEFMQTYFSDAALFIHYNRGDAQDTFHQIMDKYNWIISHKEEALKLAKKAQKIFRDNFALDKQLLRIVSNHSNRFFSIARDLFAKDDSKRVLVTYVLNSLEVKDIQEKLLIVVNNIKHQYYFNISLAIAADYRVKEFVDAFSYSQICGIQAVPMDLFDKNGIRSMTDGQAICKLKKNVGYEYYINTSAREIWFYDHITTLVRSIEDDNSYGAYSGRAFLDADDKRVKTDFYNVYSDAEIASVTDARMSECPGEFLFAKKAEQFIPEFIFDSLDGLEHYAYICLLQIKHNLPVSFSKRMTVIDNGSIYDDRKQVLNYSMQMKLIQDMIRFELKSRMAGGDNLSFSPSGSSYPDVANIIKESFLKVPMKRWVKYKYHMAMGRFMGYSTTQGQKHMKKAERIKNTFFEYWG